MSMATTTAEPIAAPVSGARRRLSNVDALRAVAALAVLVGHAYALGGRAVPIKAQYWYDVPLITLATGVWLFFAISGYVIGRPFVDALIGGSPLPSPRPYAVRRAARVYPLYWVALGAVIALDGGQGTRAWQYVVHTLLLNNLVPGRQGALFSVAWTLTLEVLFYLAVPLLAMAIRARRRVPSASWMATAVLASWALSIAFTTVADLQGDGQIGLWLRGSLLAMWQMFCPGLLIAIAPHLPAGRLRALLVTLPSRSRVWPFVALAAIIPAALLGAVAPLRFGIPVYQLLVDASRPLFAVGYGLVLAAAIAAPAGRRRIAVTVGVASYGIYLLHPVIAALLQRIGIVPARGNTLGAFAVDAVVLAGLTIAAALISWRWLERPLLRRAAALGDRH
jgi:peptidoglycan/LPS O-acetylase OafA/YrhL